MEWEMEYAVRQCNLPERPADPSLVFDIQLWWGTPLTGVSPTVRTPQRQSFLHHQNTNILESASIRSIEQKERYKTYRKLFELMVVVIS